MSRRIVARRRQYLDVRCRYCGARAGARCVRQHVRGGWTFAAVAHRCRQRDSVLLAQLAEWARRVS